MSGGRKESGVVAIFACFCGQLCCDSLVPRMKIMAELLEHKEACTRRPSTADQISLHEHPRIKAGGQPVVEA